VCCSLFICPIIPEHILHHTNISAGCGPTNLHLSQYKNHLFLPNSKLHVLMEHRKSPWGFSYRSFWSFSFLINVSAIFSAAIRRSRRVFCDLPNFAASIFSHLWSVDSKARCASLNSSAVNSSILIPPFILYLPHDGGTNFFNIGLKLYIFICTSNLTTQPCQIQKTSKSTTHEPLTSKLTTRQALTSKSLCRVQNHAFGLVSTKRYFHDYYSSNFFSQTR